MLSVARQPNEDVAGLRNRRISQQPPHAALGNGCQVTQQDGQRGDDRDKRHPALGKMPPCSAPLLSEKTDQHHFGQNEKAGHLRAGSDEGGRGRGRALIGVGRPEMERHGCDFEAKTDDDHDQGDNQQRVQRCGGESGGYPAQIDFAGESID